ncbi:unnamed protein product [Symbiodinium sp. CCMP2592]|nr:unnamed protein product [Symbiodinium sp. CCMP2592]
MEPGPIAETDDGPSQRLLAMLVKDVMKEWDEIPSMASLAMNDKCFVQWPADAKGQKRIPTALACKLNEAMLAPIVGRNLQHYALLYVNVLESMMSSYRVQIKMRHLNVAKKEVKIDAACINPDAHGIKALVCCHRRLADRSDNQRDVDVQKLTESQLHSDIYALDLHRFLMHAVVVWDKWVFKVRLREVAHKMEANELPYVIKICSGMDPESLEVQNRTRAIWKKRKSAEAFPEERHELPLANADEGAVDLPAIAGAGAPPAEPEQEMPPLMDSLHREVADEAVEFPPVQDAQEYVMPDTFTQPDDEFELDGGCLDAPAASSSDPAPAASSSDPAPASRSEQLETVHERFDRLSRLYGYGAALMLCGAVQEGAHYDPYVGQWKTLDGLVCPYMPATGSSAEHEEMPVVPEMRVMPEPVASGGHGLDDPIFGDISVSSGLPETPNAAEAAHDAAEESHAGPTSVDEVKQCLLAKLHAQRERIMLGSMVDNVDTCPMLPAEESLERQRLLNGSSREAFPSQITIEDTPEHGKPILAFSKHLHICMMMKHET